MAHSLKHIFNGLQNEDSPAKNSEEECSASFEQLVKKQICDAITIGEIERNTEECCCAGFMI